MVSDSGEKDKLARVGKVTDGMSWLLYKGAYEHLGMVYDTIYAQKIPQSGYTFRDEPSYERYLNDPCNTLPEDLLTEICIPIE